MNRREKEQYLREYAILKSQGKPFFPYAVAKDGAMACVVLLVIILFAVLVAFGAALYVPRWLNTARTGEPAAAAARSTSPMPKATTRLWWATRPSPSG